MKKLLLLLAAVGMIFTACEGGESIEEANGSTPQIPEITLSLQNVETEFESAEYTISVTSPYSWSATSKNNWISVNTKTGIAGTENLTFTIERNEIMEERKGTIVIKNADYNLIAELYVIQGPFIPELTTSISKMTTDFAGAEKMATITSNISWQASCDADWVTLSQTSGEKGKTTLKATINANADISVRNTTIKVFNDEYNIAKEINVTQAEFEPTLEVSDSKLTYIATGETKSVTVTSNVSWKATCDATWVTLSRTIGYEGQTTLKVATEDNATTSLRTATIKLANEKYGTTNEIKVTQAEFEPKLEVSESQLVYVNLGETKLLTIDSNVSWEMICDANWVTLSQTSGSKGERTIEITTSLNENIGNTRSATIKVTNSEYNLSKNITITQNAIHHAMVYTSTKGTVVTPNIDTPFDQPIVANVFANGKGYMIFDTAITDVNIEAFKGCTTLSSITIPESVKNFYDDAFDGCTSLKTVYYQGDLSGWCKLQFYTKAGGGTGSPLRNGAKLYVRGVEMVDITIPSDIKTLYYGAFGGCTSLKKVKISDTVTSIRTSAFSGCTSLESVILSNNISDIKATTFYECSSLKSIVIPNGVRKIDKKAFLDCTSLTSVTIPDSVTSIGEQAFYKCTSMTSVTIGNSVTSIGFGVFADCTSLTSVTIPDSVTTIGDKAFSLCTSLRAFYGKFASEDNRCLIVNGTLNSFAIDCGATKYTIPNGVTSIGFGAFAYCESLESITIPDGITTIEEWAFHDCKSLTSVTIPDSVTTIGKEAFRNCSSLTSVNIGNSVTSIGEWAFRNCSSLIEAYCKPTTPPVGGNDMFIYNHSSRKIYVPRNSVSAYKAAGGWSDYTSDIVGYDF